MYKQLYAAAIAHSFGGGTRPLRSAALRLSGLLAAAGGMSYVLSLGVQHLQLAALPHPYLLAASAAFAVHIAVGLALLVAQGAERAGQADTFVRLLLVWPLPAASRWLLYMLPSLILAGLAAVLVGWPLYSLLTGLGLAPPLLLAAAMAGGMGAFGLVRGLPARLSKLSVIWMGSMVWLEYLLLQHANNSLLAIAARRWYALGLGTVLVLLTALFIHGSRGLRGTVLMRRQSKSVYSPLSPAWWMALKMLRRPSVRLSFGVALLLSLGAAAGGQQSGLHDPEAYSLIAAMLAASFATDIRALARRDNPAEITALKGVYYFTSRYLAGTAAGSLLAATPLIITLASAGNGATITYWLHLYLQIATGALAGAFAGSVIVPKARDISSQFTATLLVLGILVALPQIPLVQALSMPKRTILDIVCCLVLITSIIGIEQKRNPYTWRNTHA